MMTPQELFKGAFDGDPEVVRRGIEQGHDVNLVAENGMSLLLLTIWEKGSPHIVEYLLDHGADPGYRQPSSGWNALTYAAVNGHAETLRLLFERGVTIDEPAGDWKGLMFAVSYRNHGTARMMLENGAGIDVRDEKGQTPLMRAVRSSDVEMVRMLLEYGPDVDAQDAEGRTALMYAAQRARTENLERLLAAGADPTLRDNNGRQAVDFAREKNRKKMIALLEAVPSSSF